MDCTEFDLAIEEYRSTGRRAPGLLAHADGCPRCGRLLAEAANQRLQAKVDAAANSAIAAAVERLRLQIFGDPRDQRSVVVELVRDWAESLSMLGIERVVTAVRSMDLGFAPRFAVAMGDDGTLQEARPLDFSLDLSAFGDTGWEKSAILRVSPSRIELLLKPDPDAPETERLMPRMALNRRDGRACVPDVSQHERITPHGRHVFVVWESQAGERSDEELASPLRAQVWFSRRA